MKHPALSARAGRYEGCPRGARAQSDQGGRATPEWAPRGCACQWRRARGSRRPRGERPQPGALRVGVRAREKPVGTRGPPATQWRGGTTADRGVGRSAEARPGEQRPPRRDVWARRCAAVDPGLASTAGGGGGGMGWPSPAKATRVVWCDQGTPRTARGAWPGATQGYHRPRGRLGEADKGLGVHHMAWLADMQSRRGSHRAPPQASCEP